MEPGLAAGSSLRTDGYRRPSLSLHTGYSTGSPGYSPGASGYSTGNIGDINETTGTVLALQVTELSMQGKALTS